MKTHFAAATSKYSSGASFARTLRTWWYTQRQFARQQDFATALGVSFEALQQWMRGSAFPTDPLCDKLFELTALACFSPAGRIEVRREHEQKKGLSRSAMQKREQRQYLSAEELTKCKADPELAFTIRGDSWVACLECGQLLQHIRDFHLRQDGMTAAQYRVGPDPAHPRYGHNRALISNALAAKKRADVAARGNLRPDAGLGNLRPQKKGWNVPPEFRRKQSARMRRQRNPDWAKVGDDTEFICPWLMESKSLEELAEQHDFQVSGVWARLQAIIGKPVKQKLTRDDLPQATEAIEVIHRAGTNDAKLKFEIAQLCEESRKQVAAKTERTARVVMLWLPRALDWWRRNPTRTQAMSPSDLARIFAAEQWPKLKPASAKRSDVGGRPKGMTQERIKEAQSLLERIKQLGGKRGDIRIAAAKQYPMDDPMAAYARARKILSNYKKHCEPAREL